VQHVDNAVEMNAFNLSVDVRRQGSVHHEGVTLLFLHGVRNALISNRRTQRRQRIAAVTAGRTV